MTEAVMADSFGNLFDEILFHFAIHHLNTYLEERIYLFKQIGLLPLAEFIFSCAGIGL